MTRADRPADRPEDGTGGHGIVRARPSFPIGLIALDLDGTLIGDDLILGPRILAAVAGARERGVSVSIVTGRMTSSALPFARQLGLTDPIVAYQGALIRALPPASADPRLGRILAHRPLAADAARDVIAWSKTVGLEPHVNHIERFVIQADDPRADDYSAFLGARAEVVDDLSRLGHPVSKVIAVAAAGDVIPESVLAEGRARFEGRVAVTISHPRFLEFLAPGVSKLLGIRHLARRAGVPLGRVLSIGDQFNDLEMLAGAGHGAAMPSAPDAVQAAARYLAPPLAEEGAAQLIERLVLADPDAAAAHADELAAEHASRVARVAPAPDPESSEPAATEPDETAA